MPLLQRLLFAPVALVLAACAAAPGAPEVLLLGEQHDHPSHQVRHLKAIEQLAASRSLAAVALEMAEDGASTASLDPSADEAAVRSALRWDDRAWPWSTYGPSVMAAVRAGVPVLGANLPRARMRAAMADAALDATLDAAALQAQQQAIRTGHCDLLPEAQIAPMTRIQLARDRAMAAVLARARVPGKTVVLLAGAGHVDAHLGVPRHLPPAVRVRAVTHPPDATVAPRDYCAELRRQVAPRSR